MTTENTLDTWENRINTASKIMGLEPKQVEDILNSHGFEITSSEFRLEMISDEEVTPFGDLRKLFCEEHAKVPVPKLRMAMKYLRGPSTSKKTDTIDPDILALQKTYGIQMKLEDLDISALLAAYNPLKVNNIHQVLRDRYERKFGAFIAFKPGTNSVAVEETVNYVADLEAGFPAEEHTEVDGEPVRLCSVGKLPNQLLDEDPLFVGSALKRGRSTNNQLNWSNVTHDVRSFFRILFDRGEINVNNRLEIAQLLKNHNDIKSLRELFPKAYIVWSEKKKNNDLPKLQVSIGEAAKTRTQNPFGVSTIHRHF